jgi:hypothetical protein
MFTAVTALATIPVDGQVRQLGRAIVQFRSNEVSAVANYEYSQRNHDEPWLLIEFAVQARNRIAIHRDQLSLLGPDERVYPIATQPQFIEDHETLTRLLQNAEVWRRQLSSYFTTRPSMQTIRFFAQPGGIVHDSAATNLDEVAAGDLLFKSPDGRWNAGTYRLVLNHDKAKAALPITLQ